MSYVFKGSLLVQADDAGECICVQLLNNVVQRKSVGTMTEVSGLIALHILFLTHPCPRVFLGGGNMQIVIMASDGLSF